MGAWTSDELSRVGAADELEIASRRRDGALRKPVTIWVVRHADDLYVRSVNGRGSSWFRGVQLRHEGHIGADGVDKDVDFVETDELDEELDAEYRTKYRRYAAGIIDSITSPEARQRRSGSCRARRNDGSSPHAYARREGSRCEILVRECKARAQHRRGPPRGPPP